MWSVVHVADDSNISAFPYSMSCDLVEFEKCQEQNRKMNFVTEN